MKEHDPRCEGIDEQKILDDVAQYGWHVLKIFGPPESPGWAYSIGLYHNFRHPEIVVFGLNDALMHSMINFVGDEVRSGKRFEDGKQYPDLIEAYSCIFKPVHIVWYYPFLASANWFYKGMDYPAMQCVWPDKQSLYPWENGFNPDWQWAQPLLFHDNPASARTTDLLRSMDLDPGD